MKKVAYGYRPWEVDLDYPDIKSDAKFIIRKLPCDSQRVATQISLGPSVYAHSPPHPDHTDTKTLIAGACKRFVRKVPEPDRRLLRRLKKFVKKFCETNLTPFTVDTDTSFQTWITNVDYPAWRKEELKQIWENYDGTLRRRDLMCKSFMKDETYGCAYKHARCINARTDIFKCVVGPVFKLIEKAVFKHPAFIKYVPVPDRPQYIIDMIYRSGGKYVATDYTAFESHFTKEIMSSCEFVLYEYMTQHLPDHKEFMEIMNNVLAGTNIAQFKNFDVQLEATRMSGEMNTSLGNGFSNLMLFQFMCQELGSECVGVVEGDDGLFSVKGKIPSEDDFARLGFTIKSVIHDRLETASFCGIVFDLTDKVNVTDVRDVLVNFGWAGTRYTSYGRVKRLELLKAKSMSYLHQYQGCPIIQSLACYGLRVTKHIDINRMLEKNRAIDNYYRNELLEALSGEMKTMPVPYNTRLLVEELYGVPVSVQIELETYFDSLTTLQELHHWSFDLILPKTTMHYDANYCYYQTTDSTADCLHLKPYNGELSIYSTNFKGWDGT